MKIFEKLFIFIILLLATSSCGVKGKPLPPLPATSVTPAVSAPTTLTTTPAVPVSKTTKKK